VNAPARRAACQGHTLLPAGSAGWARTVCAHCGRCWEASEGRAEVDTLACPGCQQRPVCESRPTSLVNQMTSFHQLVDGTPILVRPLLYSDRYQLAESYQHLTGESRRLRFFSARKELSDDDLEYLTNIDYDNHFAWAGFAVGALGNPGVGVARYIRDPARTKLAEAAVTVLDAYQHRGLGTLLLQLLADEAQRNGITTFVSYVLWDNQEVLDALSEAGALVEPEEPGIARVEIDVPDPEKPTRMSEIRTALRHFAGATRVFLGIGGEPYPD
jgi:GNAT superfamily N-acetyltransferase